jgi:hypothetical protein
MKKKASYKSWEKNTLLTKSECQNGFPNCFPEVNNKCQVSNLTKCCVDAKLISIESIKLRKRALYTQNCGEMIHGEKSG